MHRKDTHSDIKCATRKGFIQEGAKEDPKDEHQIHLPKGESEIFKGK